MSERERMTKEEVDRIHNRDFNHLIICLLWVPFGLGFMYILGKLKQMGWFF